MVPARESSTKSTKSDSSDKRAPKRGSLRRVSMRRDSLIARITSKRRNSLAPLKMRDVVMLDKFEEVKEAAIAEHATERSWKAAVKKAVDMKAQQKLKLDLARVTSPVETAADESWRRGSIADPAGLDADFDTATAAVSSQPTPPVLDDADWALALSILAAALGALGKKLSPRATPDEAMGAVTAFCEPASSVARPLVPRAAHESMDNASQRHRVQKDSRAAPIVPKAAGEAESIFNRRLNATRSLVDMRSGPQRVLVLPQQPPHESVLSAMARMNAQGTCPSMIMPCGAFEDDDTFQERLDALRATPRPVGGARRCAPVLARGEHESRASFGVRLDVAVYCSAVVLPQRVDESDDDVAARMEAQRASPNAFIDAFRPLNETHDAFLKRCAAPAEMAAPSLLGKRPSADNVGVSTPRAARAAAERLRKSPRCADTNAALATSNGGAGTNMSGRSSTGRHSPAGGEKRSPALGAWAMLSNSLGRVLSKRKPTATPAA